MPPYAGIYIAVDSRKSGLHCTICDSQALRVSPGQLPQLLRRAPHGAEALGALPKLGFVKCDLHGDDLVVAPAGPARARLPGNRFDDELDGLQPPAGLLVVEIAHANQALAEALDKLLGAALPRAQRETRLHAGVTAAPRAWLTLMVQAPALSVTGISTSLPSRRTVSLTVSPTWCSSRRLSSRGTPSTGLPSTAVMMSPGTMLPSGPSFAPRRPAAAAGEPGLTLRMTTPFKPACRVMS